MVDSMLFVAKVIASGVARTMVNSQGLEIPDAKRLLKVQIMNIVISVRKPEWVHILVWIFRYLLEEGVDLSKIAVFCDLLAPLDVKTVFPFEKVTLLCSQNNHEGLTEVLTLYADVG